MTQEKQLSEYDNAGLVQLVVELYARMGMSNSDKFDQPYKDAKEELLKRLSTPAPQSGMRWVKASERLPIENNPDSLDDVIIRLISNKKAITNVWGYFDKFLETQGDNGVAFYYNEIEWLDEAAPQGDAVATRTFKCKACSNEKFGVKTRIAVPHTCGKN